MGEFREFLNEDRHQSIIPLFDMIELSNAVSHKEQLKLLGFYLRRILE